jgi:hypothetical protein
MGVFQEPVLLTLFSGAGVFPSESVVLFTPLINDEIYSTYIEHSNWASINQHEDEQNLSCGW